MRAPVPGGELLWLLRAAWMLWLASFLVIFAVPTLLLERFFEWSGGSLYLLLYRAEDGWSWDLDLWLPMLLALVMPTLGHRALVRRVGSAFVLQQGHALVPDYRSPRPWFVTTSPRVVRRLVGLYAGRLGAALALAMHPFWMLESTGLWHNCCCIQPRYVRSVPEYFAFATMLFAVAAFHVPMTSRVIGKRPSIETCFAR